MTRILPVVHHQHGVRRYSTVFTALALAAVVGIATSVVRRVEYVVLGEVAVIVVVAGLGTPILLVGAAVASLGLDYPSYLAGLGSRSVFELVLAAAALSVSLAVGGRRIPMSISVRPAHPAIVTVLAYTFWIGLLFLENPYISLDESVLNNPGKVLYRVIVATTLYLVVVAIASTQRELQKLFAAFAIGTVPAMALGVFLGVTHTEVLGFNGGVISQATFVDVGNYQWTVGSTFNSQFAFGMASVITFVGALAYILGHPIRRSASFAVIALATLALGAVYVSQVRAAAVGAVLAGILLVWLAPWRTRARLSTVAAIGVVGVAYLLMGYNNLGRFGNIFDTSTLTRFDLWAFAISEFIAAPLLGHGLSSFESLYYSSYSSFLQIGRISVHNTVLAIAVEQGSLGLVLFGAQIWICVLSAVRCYRRSKTWESMAIVGGLVAYAPTLLTQDVYLQRGLTYSFYALLAAATALTYTQAANRTAKVQRPLV